MSCALSCGTNNSYIWFCLSFPYTCHLIGDIIIICILQILKLYGDQGYFPGGGGHSTLGYAPCATKKTLLFFARFHRKTPIFTNFHPMTPYFSKISTFLTKCWEIFSHFGPESPYFWCISLKDPLFLCAFHSKTSFFDTICHRKTPTSEVLGGTRTSLSYVSAPPPGGYFHGN